MSGQLSPNDFNVSMDANNAKNMFRKMQTTTAYATTFGSMLKTSSTVADHSVL